VQLVEDVAQVRLHRLLAEEELRRDLEIGLAVDDEPCHLEFPFGQRVDARPVSPACPRAPMRAVAELPQLSLRALSIAQRAARVERRCCALELRHGTVAPAGPGQGPARERARERALDRG